MYSIRLCREDELPQIQYFIDTVWRKNHILARDSELFNWQHLNREKGLYNFLGAYNDHTERFDAVLGFVPLSHFDSRLQNNKDFWLALWKTDETNAQRAGLGLELFMYLQSQLHYNSLGTIGISEIAEKIYKMAGFKTGKMNQYYILNPEIDCYKIAKACCNIKDYEYKSDCSVEKLNNINDYKDFKTAYAPEKTVEYLKNRYQFHPSYQYDFYGVFKDKTLLFIMIIRKINVEDSSCLRLVDIYGDISSSGNLSSEIIQVLKAEKAEYIDCYNYGLEESLFENMGFQKRISDEVILPNYFEPFMQKNVDIGYAVKTQYPQYVFFKGDADQDRPNL